MFAAVALATSGPWQQPPLRRLGAAVVEFSEPFTAVTSLESCATAACWSRTRVEWPEFKPPFLAGAAAVAPDGKLWVLKTRPHDDPVPVYDVFDGSGRLFERIGLPARTRLVGFGQGVVYLNRADTDDLSGWAATVIDPGFLRSKPAPRVRSEWGGTRPPMWLSL